MEEDEEGWKCEARCEVWLEEGEPADEGVGNGFLRPWPCDDADDDVLAAAAGACDKSALRLEAFWAAALSSRARSLSIWAWASRMVSGE